MRRVLKWIGIVLGSLIGLLLVAGVVLYAMGNARLNRTYDFPPSNLEIPADEESIAYGKHRVEILCAGCHGDDLGGMKDWFNGGPLGTIDAANLTSGAGGIGDEYTAEDYVRAIRHGIDREGKPIFMVAVVSTAYLSDEDLAAIIAYIQTVPPVDNEVGGENFTPLAKIMLAAGVLDKLPVETVSHAVNVSAPAREASVDYGKYLVDINDCRVCHGENLNGAPFPDPTITKISPNLTPGGELGFWTEEQYIAAMTTGKTPSGYELDVEFMPWNFYRNFHDYELQAIWMYLQSLPSLPQYTE